MTFKDKLNALGQRVLDDMRTAGNDTSKSSMKISEFKGYGRFAFILFRKGKMGGTTLFEVWKDGRISSPAVLNKDTEWLAPTLDTYEKFFWGNPQAPVNFSERKQVPASKKVEQEIDKDLSDLWGRREYKD
jgi:hypothetical protein